MVDLSIPQWVDAESESDGEKKKKRASISGLPCSLHLELIKVTRFSSNAPDCVTESPFRLIWCEFTGFRLVNRACISRLCASTLKLKVEAKWFYSTPVSFIGAINQWSTVWFDTEAMDPTSQVNRRLLSESIKISHRSNDRQLTQ